jgi:predicted metal-dependent hydrolase
MATPIPIVRRTKLELGLDQDIPVHWHGGRAFETRMLDALSTLFVEGERFFISAVRHYEDRITDPALRAEVRAFMAQEGQHSALHGKFNDQLRAQGIDVDAIEALSRRAFDFVLNRYPRFALARTAAAEHFTAMFAESLLDADGLLAGADARMQALYTWHGVEEIEHKAVAFDVLQKVARVPYPIRALGLFDVTMLLTLRLIMIANQLWKHDGLGRRTRMGYSLRALGWLFGPRGFIGRRGRGYLAYLKPSFHPWQHPLPDGYKKWVDAYARVGDAVFASDLVHGAAS